MMNCFMVPKVSGALGHDWEKLPPAAVAGQSNPQSASVSSGHTAPERNNKGFTRKQVVHIIHMLLTKELGEKALKYYLFSGEWYFKI